LNIGGIISKNSPQKIKLNMDRLNKCVKEMGSALEEPFALLSFMALEVIPHLKLTCKGLFDVDLNELL
jgi:adenine deaminase